MTRRTLYRIAFVFLASALLGTYVFLFLVAPFLLAKGGKVLSEIRKTVTTSARMVYGTVTAVDSVNQSIDIDIQSPFGNGVVHLHLNILQPSFIARQDLVAGPEGIFNSLTEPKLAPLSDMHPGDRAALLISRDANLRVGTYYIIFGNPL